MGILINNRLLREIHIDDDIANQLSKCVFLLRWLALTTSYKVLRLVTVLVFIARGHIAFWTGGALE